MKSGNAVFTKQRFLFAVRLPREIKAVQLIKFNKNKGVLSNNNASKNQLLCYNMTFLY